jgi:hypothetical protein
MRTETSRDRQLTFQLGQVRLSLPDARSSDAGASPPEK